MKRSALACCIATLALAAPALAAELGDDGLHKAPWMQDTFRDMADDLAEANEQGKRLLVMFEQRGCIYCTRMHEQVFVLPDIARQLSEDYFVVQMNLFGDVEVTDFDGTALPEKDMASRWGVVFTPTLMFMPEQVGEGQSAGRAAVVTMPGAFGPQTTGALLRWVSDKGYEGEEHFQKYLARTMGGALSD